MKSEAAWKQQAETMERYRKEQPEMLLNAVKKTEAEIFSEIGIYNLTADRTQAYVRLFPTDFIVEEKISSGDVIKVNAESISSSDRKERDNTVYANMVKIGIPTNVAIERLADTYDFDINKIGYAGLKDADALTAQLVTFSGGRMTIEEIESKKTANLVLTNLHYGTHSLAPGDLTGNVFTITLRTRGQIDETLFRVKAELIAKFGVLNYFQSQRFGGLRLISHKLGRLILQGEYGKAVRFYLFTTSENDIPLVVKIRKAAEQSFPDWEKIEKIFSELPYTFSNELKIARYLQGNHDNPVGALLEVKDQTQLWIYAYSSLLFNKHLSVFAKTNGVVREKIPTALSSDPADQRLYQKYFEEDGTLGWSKNLTPFKFVQIKKRLIDGRLWPTDLAYRFFDGGVVLKFGLGKGSYATTLMSNFFELCLGLPIPEWVNKSEIDPKSMFQEGSLDGIKDVLKDYLYSKIESEL
jgi:TruD family tRNA pseudouridine synthase